MHTLILRKAALSLAISFISAVSFAQITFSNETENLLSETNFHSGVAIAVADVNNDGLDDIIHADDARYYNIELQQADGSTFENVYLDNIGRQWMMIAGDINNDGVNDILAGGLYNDIKLFTMDENSSHVLSNLPDQSVFAQGANLADINNDGWLDVFVCHDDGESATWVNNGDGTFTAAPDLIDMATTPASDNSGNYGSVWTDFDNDGDQDLYIAKCRQGVNSPTDPRRINALFVNDGDNNFTEQAGEYGLKIGAQSWTADFGDYDNDGDMDVFITNHDADSQILENDGTGHMTDVTQTAGVYTEGLAIQGMFHDFDNDGWLDVIVAGTDEAYFKNNGDGTFTEIMNMFPGNTDMESYAIGDLNNDGFLDVYAGYANTFNGPSSIDDALWINSGNDNNWLVVDPIGVISNKSAVGARVEIYGDFGVQIREIRAGESYGISNSLKAYFGIGTHESIDQVVVKFPSGIIQIIENPENNSTLGVLEDGCLVQNVEITYEGETILCEGETLTLNAPEAATYLWSTGADTQAIEVSEGGNYSVSITDADGCIGSSQNISVTYNPDATPSISIDSPTLICQGETVTISASEAESWQWSTGEMTQSIEITESGTYVVAVPGYCQDFSSSIDLFVETNMPAPLEAMNDTIYAPGTANLFVSGESALWYDMPTGGDVIGSGNFFTTPEIDETTAYYAEAYEAFAGEMYAVGMPEHSGNSMYGSNQFNGSLIFDALQPFVLRSVRVYTDTPGARAIELRDANENVISSVTVNVEIGESVLQLNMEVPEGTGLRLGTNTDLNNDNFGFNSARFQRNNTNTDYPYVVDDIVSINESIFGTDWYYYFYDWQIEKQSMLCLAERVEVLAVLQTSSVFNLPQTEGLNLVPNPTSEKVFFELPREINNALIEVFDITGRRVWTQKVTAAGTQSVDLKDAASGVYSVRVNAEGRIFSAKLVKM